MEIASIARVLLIYLHVCTVAVTLGAVLFEDIRLLTARRLNVRQIRLTARIVAYGLCMLWLTGLTVIGMDTGFAADKLMASPKLLAKLTVVTLLTLNGLVLHHYALPALTTPQRRPRRTARVLTAIGAISTTSWLYAAFMGVSKPLAPMLGFTGFVALYGALLVLAIASSQPLLARRLADQLPTPRRLLNHQIETALFTAVGGKARLIIDDVKRSGLGSSPQRYVHLLASRIPRHDQKLQAARAAFINEVDALLRPQDRDVARAALAYL
jgi:hypothetical protein